MVLIDTSIWIQLYRSKNSPLGEILWRLAAANDAMICGQIYVEFIGGFRKAKQHQEFGESFLQFPFLSTNQDIFIQAASLLSQWPRLGSGDAIIAATAMAHDVPLLTLDRDFRDLEPMGLTLFSLPTASGR